MQWSGSCAWERAERDESGLYGSRHAMMLIRQYAPRLYLRIKNVRKTWVGSHLKASGNYAYGDSSHSKLRLI